MQHKVMQRQGSDSLLFVLTLPLSGNRAFDETLQAELGALPGDDLVIARPAAGKIAKTLIRPALWSLPLTGVLAGLAAVMAPHSTEAGWWLALGAFLFFCATQLPYWIPAARWAVGRSFYVVSPGAVFLNEKGRQRIAFGHLAEVSAPPPGHASPPANRAIVLSLRSGTALSIPNIFDSDPDEIYALLRRRMEGTPTVPPEPVGSERWQLCICARLLRNAPPSESRNFAGFEHAGESGGCSLFRCKTCRTPYAEYPGRTRTGALTLRHDLSDPEFHMFLEEPSRAGKELVSTLDSLLTDQRLEGQRDRTYVAVASRTGQPVSQFVPLREYEQYW